MVLDGLIEIWVIFFICSTKFSLTSNVNLRCFWDILFFKKLSLNKRQGWSSFLVFLPNITSCTWLVKSGLKIILHWKAQLPITDRSLRVCVCVCVRVHVFIFFHREGFFRLQNFQDILEGTDQRSCVVNISWLRYAKFYHRSIWKCHISPPKTKTPAALLLERKRWYILI